jgi:hypothetical protein|tara:strand:+ start:248 stop:886 length:639 start_codon:yes stop_codon:yes gene_type:complete
MAPLPHGPGAVSNAHSHDPDYPEDNWNLYQHLEPELTRVFNAVRGVAATAVFKPFARRLEAGGDLESDADEELLVLAHFASPVNIRKIMVVGGSDDPERHPCELRCYVNPVVADFSSLEEMRPTQAWTSLAVNTTGEAELITSPTTAFNNVVSIAFFFSANHGDEESTALRYIGMQGEHTHLTMAKAVDATYELIGGAHPTDGVGEHSAGIL